MYINANIYLEYPKMIQVFGNQICKRRTFRFLAPLFPYTANTLMQIPPQMSVKQLLAKQQATFLYLYHFEHVFYLIHFKFPRHLLGTNHVGSMSQKTPGGCNLWPPGWAPEPRLHALLHGIETTCHGHLKVHLVRAGR